MTRSFVTRLIFAVLLLGNALSSGVCAMLCRVQLCCPQASTKLPIASRASQASCCGSCKLAKHRAIAASVAPHGNDCCAWIGKKVDPPASLAQAVVAIDQLGVAILPAIAAVPATDAIVLPRIVIAKDDRAPPDVSFASARPRAPPVSSM